MNTRTKTGQLPITLAELRSFVHMDGTDDDAQLQRCIESGVDYIERETERDIIEGDVEELVEPTNVAGGKCVTLDRSPAISLESVTVDGEEIAEGFEFRPNSHRRSRIHFVYGVPAGTVVVRYRTGMANDPTAKQACLWAASHFFCNREPEVVGGTINQFTSGLRRMIKLLGAAGYA